MQDAKIHIMDDLQVITEKHPDGFVSYALGLDGIVIAQGDSHDESLTELMSAIKFHTETFGSPKIEIDS